MKNTNNLKKFSDFSARPVDKHNGTAFVLLQCKFHNILFMKNKMAADKFWRFYGFRVAGKHIFAHSPSFELHFALTKTTAICMHISVASIKVLTLSKIDEVTALYRLQFRSGRGIPIDLGVGKCAYVLAEKDASLRALALNPHEILARQLVSICEVKFQQDILVTKG